MREGEEWNEITQSFVDGNELESETSSRKLGLLPSTATALPLEDMLLQDDLRSMLLQVGLL
jgi:hypothetical protein